MIYSLLLFRAFPINGFDNAFKTLFSQTGLSSSWEDPVTGSEAVVTWADSSGGLRHKRWEEARLKVWDLYTCAVYSTPQQLLCPDYYLVGFWRNFVVQQRAESCLLESWFRRLCSCSRLQVSHALPTGLEVLPDYTSSKLMVINNDCTVFKLFFL